MKDLVVELQDSIKVFKDCIFKFDKESDCFIIRSVKNVYNPVVVGMFPKEAVIGVYYRYKENKE